LTLRLERQIRTYHTSIDIQRFIPSFILAGYGIFIISLFLRHVMSWYINPAYIAPTTLAGAVLVGLAVSSVARRPERGCAQCDSCECDGCNHEHATPRLWTYGLLILPLLLALVFPPRGLASFSAIQRGPQIAGVSTLRGAATVKRVSLSVDTRSFTMQDWVGALSADPNPRDYNGKPVQVTGMVLHDASGVPAGHIMVIRYMVTCCIADARPVGLIVRDTSHGELKDNQWVTVSGKMGAAASDGQKITVVIPSRIKPTKTGNPYIY
jgi:putative membrane protein